MKKEFFMDGRKFLATALLILMLGAVVYSNSFSVPFIYDDIRAISENHNMRQPLKSLAFLSGENSNRPLLMLTFALNYAVGGLNVNGYHVVNLLFHALNSFLIFILAYTTIRQIKDEDSEVINDKHILFSSLAGALFFLCNPLATESVTYISSRSSVSSTTFLILGLLLFVRGNYSEKHSTTCYLFSILSFFTAMGFKETALIFPVIVLLYDIFFLRKRTKKKIFYFYLPLLLSILILFSLKFNVISTISNPDGTERNIIHHFLTELGLIPFFFWKTLLPFNLNIDHDFQIITSPLGKRFLITLLIWSVMLWTAVKSYRYSRIFSFSILWFIICALPHLFIRLHDLFAERWIYLSMVGAGFLIASILNKLEEKNLRRKATFLIIAVILFCSLATFNRNNVYSNDLTLWKDSVKKSPQKARPHNNFGFALQNKGFTKEAITEYLTALKISPEYIEAHNNLGAAYAETGLSEKAKKEFERAIELKRNSPKTYNNLGMLYQNEGLLDLAIRQYKKALKYNTDFAEAHNNLGFAYYNKGMMEDAMRECKKAISLQKNFPEAHHNLGLCYEAEGMTEDAVRSYERALRINSKLVLTHIQLGKIFLKAGLKDKALTHFKAALKEKPQWQELRELVGKLK